MNKFARFVKQNSKAVAGTAAAVGSALALPAHAAIDTTAALAGVTDAQTAILAVLGGMITLGIAVWGTKKVLKYFRG